MPIHDRAHDHACTGTCTSLHFLTRTGLVAALAGHACVAANLPAFNDQGVNFVPAAYGSGTGPTTPRDLVPVRLYLLRINLDWGYNTLTENRFPHLSGGSRASPVKSYRPWTDRAPRRHRTPHFRRWVLMPHRSHPRVGVLLNPYKHRPQNGYRNKHGKVGHPTIITKGPHRQGKLEGTLLPALEGHVESTGRPPQE